MNLENYKEYPSLQNIKEDISLKSTEQFYQLLKKRRSIRDFSDQEPHIDIIKNAIMAAGTAPNGANKQPWFFGIIREHNYKRQIREAAEAVERQFYCPENSTAGKQWLKDLRYLGTDPQKPYLESGATLIAIFAKLKHMEKNGNLTPTYYPIESTCIATGLMITSLHKAGLATLTHTPKPMKFLNNLLGLQHYYRPIIILVAGYAKEPVMVPNISKKNFNEIAEIY